MGCCGHTERLAGNRSFDQRKDKIRHSSRKYPNESAKFVFVTIQAPLRHRLWLTSWTAYWNSSLLEKQKSRLQTREEFGANCRAGCAMVIHAASSLWVAEKQKNAKCDFFQLGLCFATSSRVFFEACQTAARCGSRFSEPQSNCLLGEVT